MLMKSLHYYSDDGAHVTKSWTIWEIGNWQKQAISPISEKMGVEKYFMKKAYKFVIFDLFQ